MKYLISTVDDDACYEVPLCICNTRADAEELVLSLTEEEVYYQAIYKGIEKFFQRAIEFKTFRRPKVKYETEYGIALWFMSGTYFIEELGEY